MISISNFQKGQSLSPYVTNGAFWKSANLDVSGQLGIARINYLPVKADDTNNAVDELAGSFTQQDGVVYFATINGSIYTVNAITKVVTKIASSKGYFCEVWNDYLITTLNTNLYAMKISTGVWTTISTGLESTYHHKIFSSRNDGKLYIANGRYVAVLEENANETFDPTNTDTFTLTVDAFKIPKEYNVMSFAEISDYIVIASIYGSGNFSHTTYFLWDGATTNTPSAIYDVKEQDITTPLSNKNQVFFTGGNNGNIYSLSVSGVELYGKIPFDNDNNVDLSISYFHRNQLAWWNNKLMVGVGSRGNNRISPTGIYSVDENGNVNCEHLISTQEDGTNKDVIIGGILSYDSDTLVYSWRTEVSGTKEYGIDIVTTDANRVPSYGCYLESLLYPVGTMTEPKSFSRTEVILSRPLQTGEGVRVKWRRNVSGDWTTLDTKTYSDVGALSAINMPGIHNLQNVQVRVELTTGDDSRNTPYLNELRLID